MNAPSMLNPFKKDIVEKLMTEPDNNAIIIIRSMYFILSIVSIAEKHSHLHLTLNEKIYQLINGLLFKLCLSVMRYEIYYKLSLVFRVTKYIIQISTLFK